MPARMMDADDERIKEENFMCNDVLKVIENCHVGVTITTELERVENFNFHHI